MNNLKLNLIICFFRLRPSIKRIDRDNYKEIIKVVKREYHEISERTAREKGVMAFHRMFLVVGLALYKALQDTFPSQEERIEEIHDILWNGFMKKNIRFTPFFIRRSKDPFGRYLQILGPSNEWFFPCPPWEKEPVEIENGVGWYQRRCPMMDFFEKEEIGELTRACGDMDERTAELLPEHIELRREKPMCQGDDWCDFLYYREEANCRDCLV